MTDTEDKDINDVLRSLLQKLMNYQPPLSFDESPEEDVFDGNKRIQLILVIK